MSRIDFVTGAPEKYAHLVDALSGASLRDRQVLDGVSDAALRREPADGNWSAQRILGHVAYLAEANDVFFHQMATMTDPVRRAFPSGYDAPEMDALPVAVLLQRIEAALASSVELLSRTPDAAWGRPGYVRGMRRSLRQMVAYHAAHFDEHLAEIRRLLAT